MSRITIIDDDFEIADCLKTILEKYGYSVIHMGTNFSTAKDKIKESRPNLILMDIDLKDRLNGIDLTKQIKNDPDTCDIPVIVLTNQEEKSMVGKIIEESFCDAYIFKNFIEKELIELIKIYIK